MRSGRAAARSLDTAQLKLLPQRAKHSSPGSQWFRHTNTSACSTLPSLLCTLRAVPPWPRPRLLLRALLCCPVPLDLLCTCCLLLLGSEARALLLRCWPLPADSPPAPVRLPPPLALVHPCLARLSPAPCSPLLLPLPPWVRLAGGLWCAADEARFLDGTAAGSAEGSGAWSTSVPGWAADCASAAAGSAAAAARTGAVAGEAGRWPACSEAADSLGAMKIPGGY